LFNPGKLIPVDETSEKADSLEEIELIRRIGDGDRASFEQFYDRYNGVLFSTAFRVLNDPTDAEDVTQEVFIMIWNKAGLYDSSRGKPLTWAVTMTRNKAIDKLRSLQRRFRLKEEAGKESGAAEMMHDRQPVDDVDSAEQAVLIRNAVMKLSTEQREVIEMAYFNGLTQNEIADRLNEPLGTIKARIRRGMIKLKKLVGPQL
jgi:RNA polymerase sigma-70 factor (ECF subfamily)